MTNTDVKVEYQAYQAIRRHLAVEIQQLDLTTASAPELRRDFGITPTVLRRLVSAGRVRPVRKSRRRNARVRYHVRDVLRALVADGIYATGRVRRPAAVVTPTAP